MIDTFVCAAPTGTDGPGRVRVPALRWASPVTSDAGATGGAMPTTQPVGGKPCGIADAGTTTGAFVTTGAYTTLGNHSPGRPRS